MTSLGEIQTASTQDKARIALGLMLATTGTAHLTFARKPFHAQVPPWIPMDPDTVVVQSGIAELALASALLFLPRHKRLVGRIAAAFFVAIFPGNVAQYRCRRSAFGLNTDAKRFARLFGQPVLIAWALAAAGDVPRN